MIKVHIHFVVSVKLFFFHKYVYIYSNGIHETYITNKV